MRSRPTRSVGRPGSHSMLLVALLVCTLGLATTLAYEAHDAARSHRATAERALHDYAAVAAWELVAGVNESIQSSLGGALAPMTRARDVALRAAPGSERSRVERRQRAPLRKSERRLFTILFSNRLSRCAVGDVRRRAFAGNARVARRYDHNARTKRVQA
jgi:hypothetical protein